MVEQVDIHSLEVSQEDFKVEQEGSRRKQEQEDFMVGQVGPKEEQKDFKGVQGAQVGLLGVEEEARQEEVYQEVLEGFKEGQEGPSGEQEDTRLA